MVKNGTITRRRTGVFVTFKQLRAIMGSECICGAGYPEDWTRSIPGERDRSHEEDCHVVIAAELLGYKVKHYEPYDENAEGPFGG